MGRYEQDVVEALGKPEEIQELPQARILLYHKSVSTQSVKYPKNMDCIVGEPGIRGPVVQSYDDYKFYVRNGVVVKYDANIQYRGEPGNLFGY
jgi:hypothetical protein